MRPANLLRLALLALMWGSNFLFIRVALQGLSPTQILLGRIWLGALVLLSVLLVQDVKFPRSIAVWGHLAVAAVIANIVPYYLFAWAEQYVTSNVAGVLNATTPLFALGLAVVMRVEQRLTLTRAVGFLLGFIGSVTVLAPWRTAGPDQSLIGDLACLVAASSYALAYIYQAWFLTNRDMSPLVLATGQLIAAAVLLLPAAPFTATRSMTLSSAVVVSIFLLGALGTGVANILNYRLIADEGPTTASIVSYLLPVVAVALGGLILDEPITWNLLLGVTLVLTGLGISEGRFTSTSKQPRQLSGERA
jgi:drug/metabolite transporter (DMT)-like permease